MSLTSYQTAPPCYKRNQSIGYPDQCNKNFFLARSFSPFNLGFMVDLNEVVVFCDSRVNKENIPDFPGSCNGLQIENRGEITKVGAAAPTLVISPLFSICNPLQDPGKSGMFSLFTRESQKTTTSFKSTMNPRLKGEKLRARKKFLLH